MEFKKENINPKGWKTGDCVVRAIAGATGLSWQTVYYNLCSIGEKKCRMPNDKKTYEQYLKDKGWIKQKMPVWYDAFGNRNRYTVKELIDEYPNCIMIISMASHLTYAENGTLVDTWNCGSKSVGNYWIKPNNSPTEKQLNELAKDVFSFMKEKGVL